jgi:two-component system sensor histidine kinase/response regulator
MMNIKHSASRARTGRRILVVDDNPVNIQLVGAALGREGYDVIPALSGRKALEKAASEKPDLILLDVVMPEIDGLEVCRRLRESEESRDVPIIFLSAAEDREIIVRALSVGGVDYVTKPFDTSELLWRIRVQLTLQARQEESRGLAREQEEQLGLLAHDLKSLLSGIILSAKLARDRLAAHIDKRTVRMAAIIAGLSARLLGFVQDFLAGNERNCRGLNDPARIQNSGHRSARILVADDCAHTVEVVRASLGRLGHEVTTVADGAEAVREVKSSAPDLVLLDTRLSDIDGFRTCARIHDSVEGRNIPVILVSESSNKEFVVRALESGAFDYIQKPFHPAELTLRVETQLALKFALDKLAQLTECRERSLGLLAKEFETQLVRLRRNAASMFEQTRGLGDKRSAQMAENIKQATTQLVCSVGRFFDEAGGKHLALRPEPMSLRRAIARTMDWYLEPALAKDVRLLFDVPNEEEGLVVADKQGVNRVLDNLLSNAIKFSPPRTTVRLSIHSNSRTVQCRIADQGPGFTAADKERMFERFGRLSAQPTGEEASTGLGLSIVRELARAMGGEVICQSSPGRGAAFTVGFPRPLTDSVAF